MVRFFVDPIITADFVVGHVQYLTVGDMPVRVWHKIVENIFDIIWDLVLGMDVCSVTIEMIAYAFFEGYARQNIRYTVIVEISFFHHCRFVGDYSFDDGVSFYECRVIDNGLMLGQGGRVQYIAH
jgi:hypothetical protein